MQTTNINPFYKGGNKSTGSPKSIKIADLFTHNNAHGYFSRDDLHSYTQGMTEYKAGQFLLLFEYMEEGHRITNPLIPVTEEDGTIILWLTFKVDGIPLRFKMKFVEWLLKLTKDYQKGKLHGFTFSVDELQEELNPTVTSE